MRKNFKKNFITGLITILPFVLTIWLLMKIFNFMRSIIWLNWFDDWINFLMKMHGIDENYLILNKLMFQILILFVSFCLITFLGWIISRYFGRETMKIIDNIFTKVPFSKKIYLTLKQVIKMIFDEEMLAKRKIVIIEYPTKNCFVIGFLTNKIKIKRKSFCCIFVPTTPSPASGNTILIESKYVREIKINSEKAVKFIISGGIIDLNDNN